MYSLPDLLEKFPDDLACATYLFQENHKNTKCPNCKRVGSLYLNKKNLSFACSCGAYQVYPRMGTLFAQSRIHLHTWFMILFFVAKGPINALELQRVTGITYNSAWKALHKCMMVMAEHLKDKQHLTQWLSKVQHAYGGTTGNISEENMQLYLAGFQFRQEQKEDPFLALLHHFIHP